MAYVTPKTDWTSTDGVAHTDMNRIEGNTKQNHDDVVTVDGLLDTHTGDSTIHQTTTQTRAATAIPLYVECRTSDPASPVNGMIWLRTDL